MLKGAERKGGGPVVEGHVLPHQRAKQQPLQPRDHPHLRGRRAPDAPAAQRGLHARATRQFCNSIFIWR